MRVVTCRNTLCFYNTVNKTRDKLVPRSFGEHAAGNVQSSQILQRPFSQAGN